MSVAAHKREIKIYVERTLIDEVDSIAKSAGLSRSKMIGNLLAVGIEDAKILQKFGVLKAVKVAREFAENHQKENIQIEVLT